MPLTFHKGHQKLCQCRLTCNQKNGPSMRVIVSNPQIALFSTTVQLGKIKIHGQEKKLSPTK